MADVQMQGIEFEISANADGARKSLDKLANTLTKLKGIIGNGLGLSAVSKDLKEISDVTSKLNPGNINSLSTAIRNIGQQSGKLEKIASSLERISGIDFSKISGLSDSLGAVSGIASATQTRSRAAGKIPVIEEPHIFETISHLGGETAEIDMSDAFRESAEEADRLADALRRVDDILNSSKLELYNQKLEDLKNQLRETAESDNAGNGKMTSLGLQIRQTEEQIERLQRAEESAVGSGEQLGDSFSSLGSASRVLSTVEKAASRVVNAFKKAVSYIVSFSKALGETLVNAAKKAYSALGKFAKLTIGRMFERAVSPVKNFAKSLGDVVSSFKRILMYRAIRSLIKQIGDAVKTGTSNLYEWSKALGGTFANSMNEAASSLTYLKNSIGAAAAPLVNALVPALSTVVNWVVTLINALNRLFALLAGASSWTRAVKVQTEFAEATSGAAKAMEKYLLPFDEINKLNDTSGGGGGADVSDMFEELELAGDFADRIREAIANGDWEGAGRIIADRLNGIIADWDAEAWGRALGEKLNKGIQVAYGFLDEFNFEQLGEKLAEALNGILSVLDSYHLGGAITKAVLAPFDVLIGFINTLDPDLIYERARDFFQGVYDAVEGFLDRDWYEVGKSVGALFDGVVDAINSFTGDNTFGKAGASLAEFINGFTADTTRFENAGKAFSRVLEVLLDNIIAFARGLDTVNLADAIGGFVGGAIAEMQEWASQQPWEELGRNLMEGVTEIVTNLNTFFETNEPVLAQSLGQFVSGAISEFSAHASEYGQLLANAFIFIIDELCAFVNELDPVEVGTAIADFINGAFERLGEWLQEGSFTQAVENIKTMLVTAINNINFADDISTFLNVIVTIINALIDAVNQISPDQWNQIGYAIGNALGNIDWQGAIEGVGRALSGAISGVIDGLFDSENGSVLTGTIVGITGVISGIELFLMTGNPLALVISALGLLVSGLMDDLFDMLANADWGGIISGVFDIIGDLIENADLGSVLAGAAEICVSFFAHIPEIITGALSGITGLVASIFESLGLDSVAGFFRGISDALRNVGTWIHDNIVEPVVSWVKNLFGIHSPSTVFAEIGGNLIGGLFNGISEAWHTITEFFDTAVSNLKTFFSETWTNIKDTAVEKWNNIKTGLSETWDTIKTTASTVFENVKNGIKEKWEKVKTDTSEKWSKIKTELSETWDNIKTSASETFENIKTGIREKWENVKTDTAEKWNNIKTDLSEKWTALKTDAAEKFENIKATIGEKWENVKTTTAEKWENIKTTLGTTWENLKTSAGEKFENIRSTISEKWENVKTNASTIWDTISTSLSTTWGEIETTAGTTFNNIKETVVTAWENLWGGIKGVINNVLGGVETWINGVITAINWLLGGISKVASAVGEAIGLGSVSLQVGKVSLPRLAKGGIVDKATLFLAGEAGKEAVIPLDRNTEWVNAVSDQIIAKANGDNFGGTSDADAIEDTGGEVINALYAVANMLIPVIREAGERDSRSDLTMYKLIRDVSREQGNFARAYGV